MKTLRLSGPSSNNSRPYEGPCSRGERLLHTPLLCSLPGWGWGLFWYFVPGMHWSLYSEVLEP